MKKYILAIIFGIGLLLVPVGSVSAIECEAGSVRAGEDVPNAADCNVVKVEKTEDQLPARITGLVNVLMAILGMAAVIVMIYGGAQMIISQGDASRVKTGRDAVIYGAIGLIVAGLAWMIVNFVIVAVTGNGGDDEENDENNQKDSSLLLEDVVL